MREFKHLGLTKRFGNSGGSDSGNVASGTGYTWTASSNVAWITFTGGATGNGNGTINFSVAVNTGQERTETIIVDGQTLTITQAAVIPTLSSVMFL
jgi:hypothetical protein